jgi:hypothetical protein
MGQGYYTLVGFGVLDFGNGYDENDKTEYKRYDSFKAELIETVKGFECAYECKQKYICIQVAVDDGFLQEWWDVPDIDFRKVLQMCNLLEACYLPTDYCNPTPYIKKWKEVQKIGEKYGFQVPDGKFMLIRDWD